MCPPPLVGVHDFKTIPKPWDAAKQRSKEFETSLLDAKPTRPRSQPQTRLNVVTEWCFWFAGAPLRVHRVASPVRRPKLGLLVALAQTGLYA